MLLFECSCGSTFREDSYHSYATYRAVTDVHRDRCTSGVATSTVAPEPDADPSVPSTRSVRQAARGVGALCLSQHRQVASLVANHFSRLLRRFRAWPFDPTDLRAEGDR